jgi:hypothetical protein
MSDDKDKQRSEADAELEREIRKGRKFTLSEAIGRMAGPGAMKGVSPITRKHQAEVEIESWLRRHLGEAEAALEIAMLRRVKESQLLLDQFEQPLVALASCIQRALDSEHLLKELVQDADIEWGRTFGERPHFETEGCPPDPDDPYTIESVRGTLTQLLAKLSEGDQ